ncbi:MAG: hypothetical protein Q4C66_15480 [Lachnospiraceae bacterium]|nr:hypothetical protein [Lachnospiraceae bacterium]
MSIQGLKKSVNKAEGIFCAFFPDVDNGREGKAVKAAGCPGSEPTDSRFIINDAVWKPS